MHTACVSPYMWILCLCGDNAVKLLNDVMTELSTKQCYKNTNPRAGTLLTVLTNLCVHVHVCVCVRVGGTSVTSLTNVTSESGLKCRHQQFPLLKNKTFVFPLRRIQSKSYCLKKCVHRTDTHMMQKLPENTINTAHTNKSRQLQHFRFK